ncbi:hsp70 family protein [Anaeramoeba flamelloides]|uniref:Hsp70 family protein n=1 Tax=Anaeramoeba flamelloides TaxID=1746091 RepID=A0ABQ8X8I7_9EUKA|nr:hsp70 family protein [Anaeramoeba flamelloides]
MSEYVIGIDFGTSRSGFAYSFKGDPNQTIYGKEEWIDYKTNTSILIKKNKAGSYKDGAQLEEVVQFGNESLITYWELVNTNKGELYEAFVFYKMALYTSKNVTRALSGRKFQTVDVITLSLKHLKHFSISHMKTKITQKISLKKIHWVVTVPAIWSEKAKVMMKIACKNAGFVPDINDPNLSLIHEPEAAALEGFYSSNPDVKKRIYKNGKVLILDAGSGTIDITVLKIDFKNSKKNKKKKKSTPRIQVIIPAKGGSFGSYLIDQQFLSFLYKFLQNGNFENSPDFIELFEKWKNEKHKTVMKYKNDHNTIGFRIDGTLYKKKSLRQLIKDWNKNKDSDDIKYIRQNKHNEIRLKKCFLYSLFKDPVNKVVETCNSVIEEYKTKLKHLNTILMIGSYSNSEILFKKMRKHFKINNISVVVGTHPGRSIVMGAVRYGLTPQVIKSRTYEYNYGLRWDPKFNEKIHKKIKRYKIRSSYLCKDVYKPLIKKNVSIPVDKEISYEMGSVGQNLNLEIFRTKKKLEDGKVYYIDDDGFEYFGRVIIENIKASRDKPVKIITKFIFGQTTITVKVINTVTDQNYKDAIVSFEKIN